MVTKDVTYNPNTKSLPINTKTLHSEIQRRYIQKFDIFMN